MKKILNTFSATVLLLCFVSCSSTKNTTHLKANKGNLSGLWTLTDISIDMPADLKITDIFDEAPYQDFKGSKWNLIKNGKGSYTLENGTSREIYWSLAGKGEKAVLQFKKLMGEKARNVDTGYQLHIDDVGDNSFKATSFINADNGNSGKVTYTFTK